MQFAHELIVPEVGFPFKLFLFEGREGHYHREKHWHRSIEIFAVCDGELEFKIDEKTWHLTAGEFMIVNSNEVHEVDSPLPNETIVLQIPLKVFEKYYTGEQFIWFTHEPGRKDARFMELLEELYKTYCEKQCGYDMKMNSIFYHLLYLLVKEYRLTEVEDAFVRKNKNLNKLSAIKYAGITYKSYLQNIRLEYAMKDLKGGKYNITETALRSGFSGSKAMARAFRKKYGILPSEYRENA